MPKISAGAPVIKQESRYKFTPNVRSSPEIKYGRKLATVSEPIKIENFATRKSILSESVRLNDEGLVGMNRQQYSFDVLNQKSSRDSLKIPDLVGKVEIDLFL